MRTSLHRRPLLEGLRESELDIFGARIALLLLDHVAAVVVVADAVVVFPGVLEVADDVGVVEGGRGLAERPVGVAFVVGGDREGESLGEEQVGETTRWRMINWSSSPLLLLSLSLFALLSWIV